MAQSAAWVLLALVTLQVAAAYPARKPELRDGDSGDAIAQALAQANRFKTDAESALKETLKAAAIGDLPVAQAASALAYLSSLAALEQAQRAETLGVQAAAFEVFGVFEDDSTYADFANFDTGESIVSAFKGATDELMDFAQRATQGRRLPREEVDSEIEQFNRLSVSAISEFSSLLDKFILQAKSDMAEAYKQISLWEVEVHQASDAANAASAAAAAAQEAYHQATTPAPTPAPTDAPTQSPTNSPSAAPTDAPTQAPTDAPHNIRRKRSSDVDPFEAIKLILTGIDSDYSAYASFAKDYAKNVTKDAFDTAADVIDKNHLYYYQDDYIDALNKMRDGGYDILKASNNKFSEADQAADAADKSLDKYNPRPLM